ncbi:hypothetical protein B0H13DRAFT_810810 [Mycena leptocephala]|nr:hypothetical protein B0H13DRAFT_810810 [Mycena leptocephala]
MHIYLGRAMNLFIACTALDSFAACYNPCFLPPRSLWPFLSMVPTLREAHLTVSPAICRRFSTLTSHMSGKCQFRRRERTTGLSRVPTPSQLWTVPLDQSGVKGDRGIKIRGPMVSTCPCSVEKAVCNIYGRPPSR